MSFLSWCLLFSTIMFNLKSSVYEVQKCMFMVRIDFANQVFFCSLCSPQVDQVDQKPFACKKVANIKKYLFLKTLQQSCFPTVKITKCKYKGCLFHVGSTKTSQAVYIKCGQVIGLKWIRISKLQ